ncbi:hypothetical protein SH661x_004373 [Planctomicrobium sp. SH661]|uniref:hypothetical protein n=1 Tax=Planctomicrobium sp. SH661 TaxID=3448124 RepID=UPI003F5AFC84
MNTSDIHQTDSRELRQLADGLKHDAQALWDAGNKPEAMKLFRLFQRIARELHRRRNPANVHLWN